MIKQTNAQETLKRGKGKYKGDEDNLKSSTQNPEKELSNISIICKYNKLHNTIYFKIKKIIENLKSKLYFDF